MAWDDKLNELQETAASHYGKHARLLAGPGTGKTLCLARRALYLIKEVEIPASQIVALTFTRAAAAELRERLRQELGVGELLPRVSTLHSFSLSTILQHPARTRLPQPIRIADDYEERFIIQEELKWILELSDISEVKDLIDWMSADWETLTEDWQERSPNPDFIGAWIEHREIYGYTLRAELVYQLKLALDEGYIEFEHPCSHLLVDEYQDLNACDLEVIRHIANSGAELYGAGDDDQSIYGFRHANPEGIRRFTKDYVPSEPLDLEICKRCDRRILDYALYVARQDTRRLKKPIRPEDYAEEGEVRLLRFTNQNQEARVIAKICDWLINGKDIEPSEILILVRTDKHQRFSKPIREALRAQNIAAGTAANPLEPLESNDFPQGRELLCFLRLKVNYKDQLAWRTILDIRKNGVGEGTFQKIYDIARDKGEDFFTALQNVRRRPTLVGRTGRALRIDCSAIDEILNEFDEDDFETLEDFIEEYAELIIKDEEVRDEVVSVFTRVLDTVEVENLQQLLRDINVALGFAEQERDKEAVSILTMHQAKGLSADAVFIIAAEDEYMPGRDEGEAIDDARRLLYVSLTRARHYLYITHCKERIGQQRFSGRTSGSPHRELSRFLRGGPVRSESGLKYLANLRNVTV